jgi:hypothetical protein
MYGASRRHTGLIAAIDRTLGAVVVVVSSQPGSSGGSSGSNSQGSVVVVVVTQPGSSGGTHGSVVVVDVVVVEVVVVEVVVVVSWQPGSSGGSCGLNSHGSVVVVVVSGTVVVVVGTVQSPDPVAVFVRSPHVATTVRDVPEKPTVADPPPGMVPLEGDAPAAEKVIVSVVCEFVMVHWPVPVPAQATVTTCAEAVDAPNTSAPIPSMRARMSRRADITFRRIFMHLPPMLLHMSLVVREGPTAAAVGCSEGSPTASRHERSTAPLFGGPSDTRARDVPIRSAHPAPLPTILVCSSSATVRPRILTTALASAPWGHRWPCRAVSRTELPARAYCSSMSPNPNGRIVR